MSRTRMCNVISRLADIFTQRPDIKSKCIVNSNKALEQEYTTLRIFDDFPSLLSKTEITELSKEMTNIINYIRPSKTDEGNYILQAVDDIRIVSDWETKIAKIACNEILDSTGHIKPELITLLEWKTDLSQQQTCMLMSAFVSAVNQEVFRSIADTLNKQSQQAQAIFSYLNKCNGDNIKLIIQQQNKIFDLENFQKATVRFPLKANKPVSIAITGLGLLFASYYLYSNLSGNTPTMKR